VVCHTEQRKYGRTEATRDASLTFTSTTYRFYDRAIGNLPNEIHKIHGGGVLAYKNYDYADVKFNEVCTRRTSGTATSATTPRTRRPRCQELGGRFPAGWRAAAVTMESTSPPAMA
jgi:hypothetical protein